MTPEQEFERLLTNWLVDAAPGREPDGLLPRALVRVRRHSAPTRLDRRPSRGRAIGEPAAPTRLIVALTLSALLAAASSAAR